VSNKILKSPLRCNGGELFTVIHDLESSGYQLEGFKAGGPLGNAGYEVKFYKKPVCQGELEFVVASLHGGCLKAIEGALQ
jgi:hypothetical protein